MDEVGLRILSFLLGSFYSIVMLLIILELTYKERKEVKGHKQYIVIELAEGYDYLYSYKIFDNYEDAYNYYKEADELVNIRFAEIGEYNFLESFTEKDKGV